MSTIFLGEDKKYRLSWASSPLLAQYITFQTMEETS